MREAIDIPLVAPVVTDDDSYLRKLTPEQDINVLLRRELRHRKIQSRFEDSDYRNGGPTDETILETIAAGQCDYLRRRLLADSKRADD